MPVRPPSERSWSDLLSDTSSGFRLLFDESPRALMLVELDGVVVVVNSPMVLLLGARGVDPAGRSIDELLPERYRGVFPVLVTALREGEEARHRSVDLVVLRPDGTEVPVRVQGTLMHAGGHTVVSLWAEDLSWQPGQDPLFNALLESALDAKVICDTAGLIVQVNAAARSLFGHSSEGLVGRSLDLLLGGLDPDEVGPVRVEARRGDGTTFFAQVTRSDLHGDRGSLACVIIHDLSELEELRDETDRAKAGLLHTISHELRTPLTSVLGYTELLNEQLAADSPAPLDGAERQRLRGFAEAIDRNARRELALIDDLLVVSGLVGPTRSVEAGLIDVLGTVRALSAAANRSDRNAFVVSTDAVPGSALVRGEQAAFDRGLQALWSNAVKFSAPGSRVITRVLMLGQRLSVGVYDQGEGVEPGEEEAIFESLHRAAAAVDRQTPGAGLGLSIAREAFRSLGGDVSYHREPAPAGHFEVVLPVAAQPR